MDDFFCGIIGDMMSEIPEEHTMCFVFFVGIIVFTYFIFKKATSNLNNVYDKTVKTVCQSEDEIIKNKNDENQSLHTLNKIYEEQIEKLKYENMRLINENAELRNRKSKK